MTTIQDAENLKRKIAELESCFQDFEDLKHIPPMSHDDRMDCLKKLKTMTEQLIKTYKTLKGFDGRTELWDDEFTLKLTGFNHGLHPKDFNIKGFFERNDIEIENSTLIYDQDFGRDFVLVRFKSTADVQKALQIENLRFPATCPGGISIFNGVLSKLRE